MKTSLIVGLVVLVLLALGGWWVFSQSSEPTSTPDTTTPDTAPTASTGSCLSSAQLDMEVAIEYTNGVFVPAGGQTNGLPQGEAESGIPVFCVPKGGTVTFTGSNLWIASDPHPTHTDLEGLDAQGAKANYSFTFDKVGEWGFHNHIRPSDRGLIIVVE